MKVGDLLSEHALQLRLHTPSSAQRLAKPISWSAPTELMDPTPFLSPDTLVLTSGIGLNFAEALTWNAYVERLVAAGVSALAFATGTAHRVLPRALVDACTSSDLPLLEVPGVVPLLQVDRHIEQILQQENLELVNRGMRLADECARLSNSGADLSVLMGYIAGEVGAAVALYDSYGSVISQFPASIEWPTHADGTTPAGETRITLPMGLRTPCLLAVRREAPGRELESLLGPAASVLALQLNQWPAADEHHRTLLREVFALCVDWGGATSRDLERVLLSLDLEATEPISLVVADMSGEFATTSWQLRVALDECFQSVSLAEFDGRLVALAQRPRVAVSAARDRLLSIRADQPLVMKLEATSLDGLRLAVAQATSAVAAVAGPTVLPELGLTAIIAMTAGRGAGESARAFLAPLLANDARRAVALLPTLQAFLRNDAQPSRTCTELFIHRNTLNYRLRRIEELLGVDLTTLEAQITCVLALRLWELGNRAVGAGGLLAREDGVERLPHGGRNVG